MSNPVPIEHLSWKLRLNDLFELRRTIEREKKQLRTQRKLESELEMTIMVEMRNAGVDRISTEDFDCRLSKVQKKVQMTSKEKDQLMSEWIENDSLKTKEDYDQFKEECQNRTQVKMVNVINLQLKGESNLNPRKTLIF